MLQQKLLQAMSWRYATKIFDPNKKLSSEQVNTLEQCLLSTPSSFGVQGWGFVWVTDPLLKNQLRAASWNQAQVEQASHHLVLCRKLSFGEREVNEFFADQAKTRGTEIAAAEGYRQVVLNYVKRMNEEQVKVWLSEQVYIALGNLMTSAAVLGIDTCPMGGINPAEYDRILNLHSHNLTTVVSCAVGFRSNEDKYASAPKVRFSREKVFLTNPH